MVRTLRLLRIAGSILMNYAVSKTTSPILTRADCAVSDSGGYAVRADNVFERPAEATAANASIAWLAGVPPSLEVFI